MYSMAGIIKRKNKWVAICRTLDGKEIASAPLVALNAVEEAGFFKRLWHEIRMWWDSL